MSSNMLNVDLKITLDTIQRRFSLPTPCPAWEDLAAFVKDGFELPERFKLGLCYKDQDGEYITVSSTKELAGIWPTVTADDERDLDALPPLRFSVVNIPAHPDMHNVHGPPPHLGHRGRHTRFGGPWFGQQMDGPDVHDGPEPPKDGPKPPKHPKDGEKDNLKEDVHRFIEAVKRNVADNKEVQDAYKKVTEHARSEHGPKKPKEGAAPNVFGEVAMQTEGSDGLTSGIVAAMLTPAFLGPPPPPHHGGPHRGGPHGGPTHGPPVHHGGSPREPPHLGPPPHGPPGRGPHHRPGFGHGPGHDHPHGPGGPPRGPRGPPRGAGRDHDEFNPPPPPSHGRSGPGPGRPHGRHGGPFGGRRGDYEHHGRWGPEGPGRRFRGHPYYPRQGNYRQFEDYDTETADGTESDFEVDSDIEEITQSVNEMHRNRDAF